jgi:hypothetical protein
MMLEKMVGKKLTRTLCSLLLLTFACGTLMAQEHSRKFVRGNPGAPITPYFNNDGKANVTFFSNLGGSTSLYSTFGGWVVSGPNETLGFGQEWISIPFVPSVTGHVTQIQAAAGYIAGTNSFQLGIYNDDGSGSGLPGNPSTALSHGVATITNAPTWDGTCCAVTVTAKFKSPGLAVTAGTIYWVVANTTSTSDFDGAWSWSIQGLGNFSFDGTWGEATTAVPAVAVKGTNP